MTTVTYTSTQTDQINDLKAYIEEYCSANGIDPSVYTAALDGSTLDPAILNDPAFQAYWQLAYLQLMEMIDPALVQSVYAEVGEIDFDAVYAAADAETNEFIQNLVLDSPELMTFFAEADGDSSTDPEAVTTALTAYSTDSESFGGGTEYTDEQARDLAQELGLDGMWDFLIETEEGMKSSENYLMEGLAEMDQQLADLSEALESGEITAEEFSAGVEQISAYRQIYVSLIQNFEDAWSTLLETFSQLLKAEEEGQMAIARNLSVSA